MLLLLFLVNLSEAFPSEAPALSLYSIYHKYNGRPFQYILKDMPYSSHWDAEEKAWRMKQVLPPLSLSYLSLFL